MHQDLDTSIKYCITTRTHEGKMCCGRTPYATMLAGKETWNEKVVELNLTLQTPLSKTGTCQIKSRLLHLVAVGESHDRSYDKYLGRTYGHLSNVDMPGFVTRFGERTFSHYSEKAWILVNTSAREGLPYTFMEVAACSVTIFSALDPENFASRFGYLAANDDFEKELRRMLAGNLWRERGNNRAQFVANTRNERHCIDEHMRIDKKMLDRDPPPTEVDREYQ